MSYLTNAQRAALFEMRSAMDGFVAGAVDAPDQINSHMSVIRTWHEGAYAIGDVRMYEGAPYKCVQTHDSTGNSGWNPAAAPALWMQYHGTTKDTARLFIHPTGAHDMYLAGEYAIFDDGIKRATMDTNFSPDEYPAAWENAE